MPIKDQCDQCRFHFENNCTRLVPSFDGTSCDAYSKRINLDKMDEMSPEASVALSAAEINKSQVDINEFDEDTPSDESIHGWLKFFLIVFIGIGSVASLIMSVATFESDGNFWMAASDVAFTIVYLATGILTIIAFNKRDTDAVFLAKTFVVLCFASNLLGLFTMDSGADGAKLIPRMIRSIVWCFIWFIYLCNSDQVSRLIPSSYRKTKTRDWIIVASVIILPLFCIGMGIASEKESHTDMEASAISEVSLAANQYTDGRILLTAPTGYDCEESVVEGTKVYSLSNAETGAEVTVVSDYDTDETKRNFNQYWNSWKSDELKNLQYDVIKDERQEIDGNTVFYKVVRVNLENPVDWEFALLFNQDSGKVCVVSAYSSSSIESPVADVVDKIKFL